MGPDVAGPSPDAAEVIRAAIAETGGPIPFARFMDLALYGEGGFYTSGGAAGRRGDFLTSPEVGPLFGAVIARVLDGEWDRLGRPDPFVVVDAGAGPGTLARSIAAAEPACAAAWRYCAVDVSAAQRRRHPDGVESSDELPAGGFDGVVLANELLDNLPFRLAVFDGAWREAFVGTAPDRFVEVLGPPLDPRPDVLPTTATLGARAPLQDAARAWVEGARARVRRGRVIAIDYARSTTGELAATPWRAWLRTYAAHGPGGHYLAAPGRQDVTADVAIDQLPVPDERQDQATFLRRWGIDELVADGVAAWARAAAAPDLPALAMRSRLRESEALLDAAGLGAFDVLEWVS